MTGTNTPRESQLHPAEQLLLLVVGIVAAGSVLTVATWHRVVDWAVSHQVLVPADASPLVTMPAGAGAGLDASRLAIAAAAVGLLVVSGVAVLRRYLAAGAGRQR